MGEDLLLPPDVRGILLGALIVVMGLEELRKLERTTCRIQATLHDAEQHWNIREESAKLRLRELKELADDIDGVVKEYEYEADRCKLEALKRSARYQAPRVYLRVMERYCSILVPVVQGIQAPLYLGRGFLGETDKDIIVQKLLSGQAENGGSHISVMAIVGMEGLGKTTLCQLVYNDLRLRQSFDNLAWVDGHH
ncbi:hypothetical protein EJB05_20975, partial [Eragrostis curvula]